MLNQLRQTGYKITSPRRAILGVLVATPLTAYEVYAHLEKRGVDVNLVTIYRTLELFIRLGLVGKTRFGDKTARYELVVGIKHHHHVICQKCKTIEDVSLDEKALIKQVKNQSTFQIKNHTLEFFGLCVNCQI